MAAPQHRVLLFSLRKYADKSDRELRQIFRTDGIDLSKLVPDLALDLSPDVVQIQTDKSLTLNPGRFMIRLVPRRIYEQIIFPHDLVLIMLNAGENSTSKYVSVMLGLTMRIAQSTRVSGEQASVS